MNTLRKPTSFISCYHPRPLRPEEIEQRKRLNECFKGRKKVEPCPESDFMPCYEEDFNYSQNKK